MTCLNRPRLVASCSLAALATLTANGAFAQDAGGAAATKVSSVTVTAPEVVTTAPVAPPLKSAFTESTITAVEVRDLSPSPEVTVQTMLNDQPSVFASTNGPFGVGTNINFRAFNSGQFAETYDGVALNDVFNSGVTGEAVADNQNNVLLLPQNIDSVQIYRGINNPSISSYNSLGGTINFLPRLPDHTASVDIGGSFGSFDTTQAHATFNTGDVLGYRQLFSYNYGNSEGWTPNTGDRNNNFYYSGEYDAGNGNTLNAYFIYNHNQGHTPFLMPTSLLQENGGFYQYPSSVAYENDLDTNMLGIIDLRLALAPNVIFDNKFFGGGNNYARTSYANPIYNNETAPGGFSAPGGIVELWNQAATYDYWIYYPNGPTYNPKKTFGAGHTGDLAVEPQQVVLGEAEAADGCSRL